MSSGQEARDKDVQAAFAALGRFYQEFGQACFALQLLIQGILQQKVAS